MAIDKKNQSSIQTGAGLKRGVLAGYFDDLLKSPDDPGAPLVESNDPEFEDKSNAAISKVKDTSPPEKNASSVVSKSSPIAVHEESFSEPPPAQSEIPEDNSQTLPEEKTAAPATLDASTVKTNWEADNFDALLVKLDHASLAIPLLLIGSVYKTEQNLVSIANQPAWFLGIYPHNGQNIKVLDTQYLVTNEALDSGQDAPPKFILTIANSPYGLACCGVEKVIKLNRTDIRWRAENRNNQWYRGIVTEYMCILLDAQLLLGEWLE